MDIDEVTNGILTAIGQTNEEYVCFISHPFVPFLIFRIDKSIISTEGEILITNLMYKLKTIGRFGWYRRDLGNGRMSVTHGCLSHINSINLIDQDDNLVTMFKNISLN